MSSGRRWTRVLAVVVLTLMLGFTAMTWSAIRDSEQELTESHFQTATEDVAQALRARMAAYTQILRGAAAAFAVGGPLTRQQWHEYVASLHVAERYPGIDALNFVERFPGADLGRYLQRMRAETTPSFLVYPEGVRPEYSVVTYAETASSGHTAELGFDMCSDPVRCAALNTARDTGMPVLSGRVVLVDNALSGHLFPAAMLIQAVYSGDRSPTTTDARRRSLLGYAVAPFRIHDFLHNLMPAQRGLQVSLYDGEHADAENLLYESTDDSADVGQLFHHSVVVPMAGRTWLLEATGYRPLVGGPSVWSMMLLTGGISGSLLVFAIMLALGRAEARADDRAIQSLNALRETEQRHRDIVQGTADGIFTLDEDGRVRTFNRAAERMFGHRANDIIGRSVSVLIPEHVVSRSGETVFQSLFERGTPAEGVRRELVARHQDGHEFPIYLALSSTMFKGERHYVLMVSDISERKSSERLLAEAHSYAHSIVDNAPFGIVTTDLQGKILSINPSAERMLGYRNGELIGHASYTVLHHAEEIAARAMKLSAEFSTPIEPGFGALVARAQQGVVDEQEWNWVRRDRSLLEVLLTLTALRGADGKPTGYLALAHDVSERKRSEEYTRHIAEHDFLTGLPNRMLLQERMNIATERARADASLVAVILVDLDHFKRINESLGHQIGDQLLQQVADRLRACVRSTDTVARMGGDEFVVVVSPVRDISQVTSVASDIRRRLSEPMTLGVHELQVTPSLGISMFPEHGSDMLELLKNADAALYQAKEAGRNNFQVFTPAMVLAASERLTLENALRLALARGELLVHYQPVLALATQEVVGVEALMRWHHPTRGWVSPGSFIPVAEQTGLILPMSEWMLRTACHDVRRLSRQLGVSLTLAVNVSPRQFQGGELVHLVDRILAETGFSPPQLELEITEGVLMVDSEGTLGTLRELRQRDVRVVVDDFGTGYSSLSYLKRFNIDKLKIDRSFIRDITDDPGDAAVTKAIVQMADGLGMHAVAEGIETIEQLALLQNLECAEGQGFLFSPAVSVDEFPAVYERLRQVAGRRASVTPPSRSKARLQLYKGQDADSVS